MAFYSVRICGVGGGLLTFMRLKSGLSQRRMGTHYNNLGTQSLSTVSLTSEENENMMNSS